MISHTITIPTEEQLDELKRGDLVTINELLGLEITQETPIEVVNQLIKGYVGLITGLRMHTKSISLATSRKDVPVTLLDYYDNLKNTKISLKKWNKAQRKHREKSNGC